MFGVRVFLIILMKIEEKKQLKYDQDLDLHIDRYIRIKDPLQYTQWITRRWRSDNFSLTHFPTFAKKDEF